MTDHIKQVGAPDPERKTSPIFDEYDEASLDRDLETGICYFNDESFAIGEFVRSGEEILRCSGKGVWLRWGDVPPE